MKIPKTFKIKKCRLCHHPKLEQIHDFGNIFVSNFVNQKNINNTVKKNGNWKLLLSQIKT